MTLSDTIYLLSMSGGGGRSLFLRSNRPEGDFLSNRITSKINEAKVFYSKQDAWNYKEDESTSGWQITPYSAKKLFTRKLKST